MTPLTGDAPSALAKSASSVWDGLGNAPWNNVVKVLGLPPVSSAESSNNDVPKPLPFPGECPHVLGNGSVLYYSRAGGLPNRPKVGDVRVSFLHIPCGPQSHYTAVGVQRGITLESFRYRAPPPKGIGIGPLETVAFNLGAKGNEEIGEASRSDSDEDSGHSSALLTQVSNGNKEVKGPRSLPWSTWAVLIAMSSALEGWRLFLHRAVPELLPCLAPGAHGRFSFFVRAHWDEIIISWRLRLLGFTLMSAGLEIAFWEWQAKLAIISAGVFGDALWAMMLVGAGGFAALTAGVASIFYRPISATLYLLSAFVLFATIFGAFQVLAALGCVAACMLSLLTLFAMHMLLPF